MRGAIAVAAVTTGAVIAALIAGLATPGLHTTGGNNLPAQAYVGVVGPGEQLCQGPESIPAESGSAELSVGTYGRPGPPLEISAGGATGSRAGGYRDGWLRVPLRGSAVDRPAARVVDRVCVRNRGDVRVALAGKPAAPPALVDGERAGGLITLRWRAAEEATWWDAGAEVARRVTRGKADLGTWTPVLLLALVWTGAFALVLRSVRV